MTLITPGWIDASDGEPTYDAAALRIITAFGLAAGADDLSGLAGVRPGTGLQVTLSSGSWQVAPGAASINLDNAQGTYVAAVTAQETGTVPAADATNPRKDLVVLRVYDDEIDGSGSREATITYIAGTASVSPSVPDIPDGAIALGVVTVPATGTGSASVDDVRAFVVSSGGLLPVASQAARDALTPYPGSAVYRQDEDAVEVYDGTAWKVITPSDTAWTTIPLSSGFTANSVAPAYRVVGGVTFLRGDVKRSSGSLSGPATVQITAAGAVPGPSVGSIFVVGGNDSTSPAIRLSIPANGTLSLVLSSATQGYASLAGVSYPIN